MKKHLANGMVKVADVVLKNAVCSSSPFMFYQPKEPAAARERFASEAAKKN